MSNELRIDTYLDADYFDRTLRDDVLNGLTGSFKELPPKWFYDDLGSELFDKITRLKEYYPTEAERSILERRALDIAIRSGADTLVELGSGTADKTRVLLDAMSSTGQLKRFVPFDVSEGILRSSSADLLEEYQGLEIRGVVGDFERHLSNIPGGGTRVTALLGGTVGNFNPHERKGLLTDIVSGMAPGDTFLLGTDLVKDEGRMVLAYDDPHGVTAAFNKNVLNVLNRRLNANFDLDNFEHVAYFDAENKWMDLRLRSLLDQDIRIEALDLDLHFDSGEEMRTEISAKFHKSGVVGELETVGLELIDWWTDERSDYALSLSILR
ncbi:MAG: L-histidine N-alpha-methyltransferase [Verrucomicrobiales bacterium]|jgi:L-histidine N-alpha-methyltransferase